MAECKEINLMFEDFRVEIEIDYGSDTAFFRLSEFVLDEKESKPFNTVYKEGKKIEVYPSADDLKEIAVAINQIVEQKTGKA